MPSDFLSDFQTKFAAEIRAELPFAREQMKRSLPGIDMKDHLVQSGCEALAIKHVLKRMEK